MRSRTMLIGFGILAGLAMTAGVAGAEDKGVPHAWGLGYQEPATEVAVRLHSLSSVLHWVAFFITLFVTILLAYTCWRFSEKRNPESRRFSHNTAIEIAWTLIPVVILVGIAWKSIAYLYYQETVPPAQVTVKATGSQWYWEYMYDIDGEEVYVDSNMVGGSEYSTYDELVAGMKDEGASDEEIPSREMWKLKATAPMVVPVDTIIAVQVTSTDVLHAFAVPAFGVKVDAVPGRLNQTWFRVKAGKEGTYYGQCSELCGQDHSYMPIMVEVVSKEDYKARLQDIKEKYAERSGNGSVKVAQVVE